MTLQDRSLVKQLFMDVAPRFVDVNGGYTRVVRLGARKGDGAPRALLAFSRLPAVIPAKPVAKAPEAPKAAPAPTAPRPEPVKKARKPKGIFEGLRGEVLQHFRRAVVISDDFQHVVVVELRQAARGIRANLRLACGTSSSSPNEHVWQRGCSSTGISSAEIAHDLSESTTA